MGGGTILILVLSVFMGIEQHIAQATNIVFFVPTSAVAIYTCIKEKIIDVKLGIIIIISGVVGSVVGANLAKSTDSKILKKYFGFFLALIAIFEIYSLIKEYISKRKKT